MNTTDIKIDKRVRSLVQVMNQIKGVDTFSSCGGHENHRLGQVPNGEFCVSFVVAKSPSGWKALTSIADACMYMSDVTVIAWSNEGELCFELNGKNHANPDKLAKLLSKRTK